MKAGYVSDIDRFLAYILGPTPACWLQALSGELEGGLVPDNVFAELVDRLKEAPNKTLLSMDDWKKAICRYLSNEQMLKLFNANIQDKMQ